MTLEISWPPRILFPNARPGHWAQQRRATKIYRREAFVLAQDAKRKGLLHVPATDRIGLRLEFCPPILLRKRDDDGMEAAFKAARDGIAEALGIDDNRFRVTRIVSPPDPRWKHGVVKVSLTTAI